MNNAENILEMADLCVKCGLCIPHCPTYSLMANENESPRGRIALVQGYLGGQLDASSLLISHLDHCVACRRCERLCPSAVPYSEILNSTRQLLAKQKTLPWKSKLVRNGLLWLTGKKPQSIIFGLARMLQKLKVLALFNLLGIISLLGIQRLIDSLPQLKAPVRLKKHYPSMMKKTTGKIALFTGCLSKRLDADTVTASIRLLSALGYDVDVPAQQNCCGSLHIQQGLADEAEKLAHTNSDVFNHNYDAIVSLVNGCSMQLKEYPYQNNFSHNVQDLIEFLADADWSHLQLQPLNKAVALQIPCSLQNSLRAENKLVSLLEKIPGIEIKQTFSECCGAGGGYFLQQPEISDQLRTRALASLLKSQPELLISSNLGCALHLKAGLNHPAITGKNTKVMHPAVLLEQQRVK